MSTPVGRAPSKQPPAHAPNAALLIDFDNVTLGIRSDLQAELRRLLNSDIIRGKVAVQRAYADWRRYPQYIVPLSEASIDLIFAPAFGSNKKNATDIRLAIDALELVFTRPEIGTFILLSGDSDFSSLVIKLKEYGKYVIGVGIRESSSDLLIQNCDEYFSYNELAGLSRVSDEVPARRDPWELVLDAVLEMKKRNDVMRSDRLKQVMQELDPAFTEKDVGMSRFSKFVSEAARRGLLKIAKRENGQLEVDLGPAAPGGAQALPAIPGGPDERRERERAEREPKTPRPAPLSLAEAFGLLKRTLRELGAIAPQTATEEAVHERMASLAGGSGDPVFARRRFSRFLRQAHDASLIDLSKSNGGYDLMLRAEAAAEEGPAETADGDEELRAAREVPRGSPAPVEAAAPDAGAGAPAGRRRGGRGRGGRGGRGRSAQAGPADRAGGGGGGGDREERGRATERGEASAAGAADAHDERGADPAVVAADERPATGPAPAPSRRGLRFRRGSRGPAVRPTDVPTVGLVGETPAGSDPEPATDAAKSASAAGEGGGGGGAERGAGDTPDE